MSEVKRYNVIADKYGDGKVEESESGSVVFYEDYAALKERFDFKQNLTEQIVELKAQRDALAAENAAMKELAKGYADLADSRLSDITANCESDCRRECYEACNKIPATDAYLNSVRADVIKQLHSEQKEWALVTWQYDSFDALKRAAVRHGDSELSGVIFMLDRIEGFAAQLRAGKGGE